MRITTYLVSLFFLLFLMGCAVKTPPLEQRQAKVVALKNMLLHLDSNVDVYEAEDLAQSSINYSYLLAQKYNAIDSPWLQNSLVNIGLKKRGLCYEWAEDLLRYLVEKEYKTLEFHTVGANIGYLNEHNALSVSLKGEGINNSILLDAWRKSGNLYFKKIREDKKYKWKERKGLYRILPPKGGKRGS